MNEFITEQIPNDPSLLGHDEGKILYSNTALNLLQLYFFTGFLANYSNLNIINNVVLFLFLSYVLLNYRHHIPLFSPLIIIYTIITAISVCNHLWWITEAGFPQGARTMPVVLFTMIACRLCTISGMFERGVLMNTLPFTVLIPLGMYVEGGRYYSTYLNENILGSILPFAFAVGITAVWLRRYNWKTISCLFAPLYFAMFSGRRTIMLYVLTAPVILILYNFIKNRIRLSQIFLAVIILFFLFVVLLPVFVENQAGRFGEDYHLIEHLSNLISGDATDRSSIQRRGFINLAFHATRDNWLGFGNANFPYVVDYYKAVYLSAAGHPHSGIAESLITAGYLGMLLYILSLLYMFRIGYKSPLMSLCIVWLVLEIFTESNLSSKILWPLLAIAEREFQLSDSRY